MRDLNAPRSPFQQFLQNHDAEVAVLGVLLSFEGPKLFERLNGLKAEHFVEAEHTTLFREIKLRAEAGRPFDAVALGPLFKTPAFDGVGNIEYRTKLVEATTTTTVTSAEAYAREITGLYEREVRRQMYERLMSATEAGDPIEEADLLKQAGDAFKRAEEEDDDVLPIKSKLEALDRTIPPREWLKANLLCKGFLSVLAAAGGTGKTSLALTTTLSLASGIAYDGIHTFGKYKVLYLSLEDSKDEFDRRLQAAARHWKTPRADVGNIFDLTPSGEETTRLVETNERGRVERTRFCKRVKNTIRMHGIDVVIFDPLVKLSDANENDNRAADVLAGELVAIADTCKCAVLVLHHFRKGNHEAGDIDSARGARAVIDASRVAVTMTAATTEDAQKFGLSEEERRQTVRLDEGKPSNISLPTERTKWFRLESVQLGNGNEQYPSGDSVQVIVPWQPPAALDGLTSDITDRIMEDLDAGMGDGEFYSDANAAKTRAAWQVVQRHMPGKTEAQGKEIIRKLLASKQLKVDTYKSPKECREVKRVVSNRVFTSPGMTEFHSQFIPGNSSLLMKESTKVNSFIPAPWNGRNAITPHSRVREPDGTEGVIPSVVEPALSTARPLSESTPAYQPEDVVRADVAGVPVTPAPKPDRGFDIFADLDDPVDGDDESQGIAPGFSEDPPSEDGCSRPVPGNGPGDERPSTPPANGRRGVSRQLTPEEFKTTVENAEAYFRALKQFN